MKKSLYAVWLGSLLLPFAAHADDPYLKVGVGRSHFDYGPVSADETGVSIAYGAKYDKRWGLEAGYVYFGRDKEDVFDSNNNPSSLKVQAVYLAGTASTMISPQFEAFGKLGATVNRYSVGPDNETSTRMMAGIGGLWHVSKEWGAALEYHYFGKAYDLTLSQISLSAVYKF